MEVNKILPLIGLYAKEIKMREQPHYNNLLTKEFFQKYYVDQKMSYPKLRSMLKGMGCNISISCLCNYAKKHGLGRDQSEARRHVLHDSPLDWNKSFMNEALVEAIDGFLLGDGSINQNNAKTAARCTCGVEYQEFCAYMMSFFKDYQAIWARYNDPRMKQGFIWTGMTSFHPDIQKQYQRWYPFVESKGKNDKQPPDDVRITPLSVMLWYLGDGTLIDDEKNNTFMMRLSTDSFLPERIELLVSKLQEKGIACHRSKDNRIIIEVKGQGPLLEYIGGKSPIGCYDYKFRLPKWRFSKRMMEVAEELKLDYNRLSYMVKIGKIPCYRASENGKPRFLPEHIEACKKAMESGDLY